MLGMMELGLPAASPGLLGGEVLNDGGMRWLITRTDRLGDAVLALPAIRHLRSQRPDDQILALVRRPMRGLYQLCPDLDAVHVYDPHLPMPQLRRQLRDLHVDAAVLGQALPGLAWGLRQAGIPHIAANGRRWWSPLCSHRLRVSRSRLGLHEADTMRALVQVLLGPAGAGPAADAPLFRWALPAAAQAAARAGWATLGCQGDPIILQPGSMGSSLDWPPQQMIALAEALRSAGHSVVVHLGPSDQQLASACRHLPCFGADVSLRDLAIALSTAALLVGNSTGPLHLAAALGTPVVGLYPKVIGLGPRRWGPLGARRRILSPDGPWYPRCSDAGPDHMAGISLAQVQEAIESLLSPR